MAVKELRSSPRMLPLFARAGAGMIPGVSKLPVIGGARGQDVPDLTYVRNEVVIDRDQLAAYDRVCGFGLKDTAPPTYAHILAFPMQLALMTDGSFPFPAIGLVHIYNRITQHRPIALGEELNIRVGGSSHCAPRSWSAARSFGRRPPRTSAGARAPRKPLRRRCPRRRT